MNYCGGGIHMKRETQICVADNIDKIFLRDVTKGKPSHFGFHKRDYLISLDKEQFYFVQAPNRRFAVRLVVEMSTGENPKPRTEPPPLPGKRNAWNNIYRAVPISGNEMRCIIRTHNMWRKRQKQKQIYIKTHTRK